MYIDVGFSLLFLCVVYLGFELVCGCEKVIDDCGDVGIGDVYCYVGI